MHILALTYPQFCYISFFEIGIFGYLSLRSACNYHGSADVGRPKAARKIAATNHKYERPAAWGNEPAFLGARLGVGLSKPWGVWEGASTSGLGGAPAGYLDCACRARWLKALPIPVWSKAFQI